MYSCQKPRPASDCSGEGCLGTRTIFLNASDYYLDKDTVFKFVNSANDTIVLSSHTTYTTFVSIKDNCPCTDKATNFTSQNLFKNYVFKNKDLAFQIHVGTNSTLKIVFGVNFADTNFVLHQIQSAADTLGSYNLITDYTSKAADFITLNIRGKNYYNVFNTFDQFGFTSYSKITNIYYAKNFGIIRFTYNNTVYDIL